ncbi:MAG TPA: ADYC domain-containing protein [Nannocystis sp.]|jgi:hypothetical protein
MKLTKHFVTLFSSPVVISALLLATACDAEPELEAPDQPDQNGPEEAPVELRPGVANGSGVYLNTSVIGADEVDLTKVLHAEVKLVSVKIKVGNKLQLLDSVWAVEGELFGKIGATTYSGSAFLGAEVRVRLYTQKYYNVEVPYTIATFTPATVDEMPRYTFKYWDGSAHKYLCAPDSVEAAAAIVLDSFSVNKTTGDITTRPNTIYLGCASGAVGKAPTWGYTPWGLGLADFEAMVRMVRADYCGDGVSWTVPGRAVTIEDVWGINSFAAQAGATEAIWGPSGALCIGQPREPSITAASVVCGGVPVPACPADVSLATYPEALAWLKSAAQ